MGKKRKAPQLKPFHFKPGQSGNPEGGKKHSPGLRKLRKLQTDSYVDLIQLVAFKTKEEVVQVAKDASEENLIGTIAQIWLIARARGDYDTIEKILSRVLGKVPENINLRSENLNVNVDDEKVKTALSKFRKDL
jgi:hypothetical protein